MKNERNKYEGKDQAFELLMKALNDENFIDKLNGTSYKVYDVNYSTMRFLIVMN